MKELVKNSLELAERIKKLQRLSQYVTENGGSMLKKHRDVIFGSGQVRKSAVYDFDEKAAELLELSMTGARISYGERERVALKTIEQTLGVQLTRQYRVNGESGIYFLNGYDEENKVVYEIDEEHHQNPTRSKKDKKRDEEVRAALPGCKIIRINV
jgi:very-short-patch-repair endonuclease